MTLKVILIRKIGVHFCTLGFNDAWLFQDIGDSVLFLSLVKQRLKDQFIQIRMEDWNNEVELHFTNIFHHSFLNLI